MLEKELETRHFATDDEKIGFKILTAALDIPLKTIANNSGAKGDVVVDAVRKEKGSFGYDALNNKFCDMFTSGVVDPAKVTRSALENAASVASMLLTTEAAVVDIPEETKPAMPDMSGMGGGMGMM